MEALGSSQKISKPPRRVILLDTVPYIFIFNCIFHFNNRINHTFQVHVKVSLINMFASPPLVNKRSADQLSRGPTTEMLSRLSYCAVCYCVPA